MNIYHEYIKLKILNLYITSKNINSLNNRNQVTKGEASI